MTKEVAAGDRTFSYLDRLSRARPTDLSVVNGLEFRLFKGTVAGDIFGLFSPFLFGKKVS
jgi:hypothetical protein